MQEKLFSFLDLLLHKINLFADKSIFVFYLLDFPEAVDLELQNGIAADVLLVVEHLAVVNLVIVDD